MHYPKLETLEPSVIYKQHKKYFESNRDGLNEFYKEFKNREAIISLLDFWMYALRCIVEVYGKDGVKAYSNYSIKSQIRFSYFLDYDVISVNEINTEVSVVNKCRIIFYIVSRCLQKAFLPGGKIKTTFDKVSLRLTRFIANSIPITIPQERQRNIINLLTESFEYENLNELKLCLNDTLPSVFFAEQVNIPGNKELTIDCSPMAFMDFNGAENLLLLSRKLYIIGRQHGGGYDYFSDNKLQFFEQQLSDCFIGWGMSKINEKQSRYSREKPLIKSDFHNKRIVWVERGLLSLILYPMSPTVFAQHHNKLAISYIYGELSSMDVTYFNLPYPGVLRVNDYDGMRGQELQNKSSKGEDSLANSDIVIFDISGSSLTHFCIENDILFIIILSRSDVSFFTKKKKEWFSVLRDNGLIYFDDEYGLLSQKLNEVTTNDYMYPKKVEDYHKRVFIDI